MGLAASLAYVAAGLWKIGPDWRLGLLLLAIGCTAGDHRALPAPDSRGVAQPITLSRTGAAGSSTMNFAPPSVSESSIQILPPTSATTR